MALAILDGTQTATTLSTILSSGQHITAHTVVSLGTQAKTDILSAVSSGIAISGTVTANLGNVAQSLILATSSTIPSSAIRLGFADEEQFIGVGTDSYGNPLPIQIHLGGGAQDRVTTANPLPISGTVTVGNTVSFISVAGDDELRQNIIDAITSSPLPAGTSRIGVVTIGGGTVTIGAGTSQIGSVTASISNSVTIASLPAISGTVTANTFALQGTAVTTSNFTSTTASTVLANYNATREVLTIFNEGAGNLHIAPGATCTTIAYQVRLSSGDYYEVPNHQTTITHSAVFATAGTARVTQVS